MSPLGRPTEDGEIVKSGRHYRGAVTLGPLTQWTCPACAKVNDGQKPEHGCLHCGAGDQRQSTSGYTAVVSPSGQRLEPSQYEGVDRPAASPVGRLDSATPRPAPRGELRVYRLLEYVFRTPGQAAAVLRPALVGQLEMDWGTLTATIVDSVDVSQEDRLRMARMQPGVWLGNAAAMGISPRRNAFAVPPTSPEWAKVGGYAAANQATPLPRPGGYMPPAPSITLFTEADHILARHLTSIYGLKLVYTLALALQTIAEDLDANMEPEKFLTSAEALGLARALMEQIPEDWNPPPPETETAEIADAE